MLRTTCLSILAVLFTANAYAIKPEQVRDGTPSTGARFGSDGKLASDTAEHFKVTGGTITGQCFIDGSADQIQLRVQADAAQTANIVSVEDSSGVQLFYIEADGTVHIEQTATESDEHALNIKMDAAGFGDAKAIDLLFTTGATTTGEDEEVVFIEIDDFLSIGGTVIGVSVATTEGGATVWAVEAAVQVGPIVQLSGEFSDMDSALVLAVDQLAAFISTATDVGFFLADNDTVTIGDASQFQEIEFILDTVASVDAKLKFEFSTGVGTWTEFFPMDGTDGMTQNGVVVWLLTDVPTWAVGTGSEYLVRITREKNNLVTTPIEDKVQIAAAVQYMWDKDGDITANSYNGISITPVASATLAIDNGFTLNVDATSTVNGGTHSGTNTGDDDVPESGDFAGANDLDSAGDVIDDSHNHIRTNIDGLAVTITGFGVGIVSAAKRYTPPTGAPASVFGTVGYTSGDDVKGLWPHADCLIASLSCVTDNALEATNETVHCCVENLTDAATECVTVAAAGLNASDYAIAAGMNLDQGDDVAISWDCDGSNCDVASQRWVLMATCAFN